MEKTGRGVSQVILVFVLLVCLILLGLSRTCFAAVGKAAYTSFKQFRPELRYAAENDAVTRTEDALLLKTGYGYGYAKGERFRLEEASYPDVLDGNVLVPRGVIEKKLGVHLSLEEDKLISLDTLQDVGLSSFYDSKTGLIIIGSEANMPNAETDRPFIYEACNLVTQASALDATKTGERPVLFETDEMLQFAKSMAEKKYDPWYSSWLKIKNHADEALKRGPLPYLGPSATQFRFAAYADFTKARYLTLAYQMTEEKQYLEGAKQYLRAYTDTSPIPGSRAHLDYSAEKTDGKADIGLNIAVPLTAGCAAYSLLYPDLSLEEREAFEKWIRMEVDIVKEGHRFWQDTDYYGQQYGNNHVSSHLMGLIAAAYALEDTELLQYAVDSLDNQDSLKDMLNYAVLMEGDAVYSADKDADYEPGEIYDRYRVVQNNGFGYAFYHLKFLTYSAVFLKNNGIDFFSYYGLKGENLELPYETYAEYLQMNDASIKKGHYTGNDLGRPNAYSLYWTANYYYPENSVIQETMRILAEEHIESLEGELLGNTAPFIYGAWRGDELAEEGKPRLTAILLDGIPLQGFEPGKIKYMAELRTSSYPRVEASGEGIVTVRQADRSNSCVQIEIAEPDRPENKMVYTITFYISPKPGLPETGTALKIERVMVSDQQLEGANIGRRAIDGELSTRWSADGKRQWIQFDLGSSKTIDNVAIAFYQGNTRQTAFSILLSGDGKNWNTAYEGRNSGTSADYETYLLAGGKARYVRVLCRGNSINTWNSIAEVAIYGR